MPCRILTDQNCDGLVTPTDFTAWTANYNSGNLLADQNGDELLTPTDFTAWIANYNLGDDGPRGPAYSCNTCSSTFAIGDIDGDGLLDVVVSHSTQNVVEVWRALDANNFALAGSLQISEAAAVVLADLDGDGAIDFAIGSYADNSVTLAYGSGDFNFALDNNNPIMVGVTPAILTAPARCDGQLSNLVVADGSQTTFAFVQNPTLSPVVIPVTSSFEIPSCPQGVTGPCNNFTEPPCNPNAGQGIQECMRASRCRHAKCIWAACIEYEDGGFLRGPLWVAQVSACTAVSTIEQTACLPSVVLP